MTNKVDQCDTFWLNAVVQPPVALDWKLFGSRFSPSAEWKCHVISQVCKCSSCPYS